MLEYSSTLSAPLALICRCTFRPSQLAFLRYFSPFFVCVLFFRERRRFSREQLFPAVIASRLLEDCRHAGALADSCMCVSFLTLVVRCGSRLCFSFVLLVFFFFARRFATRLGSVKEQSLGKRSRMVSFLALPFSRSDAAREEAKVNRR